MSVFEDAVEKWGEESQLGMIQEECGELISAISQYKRGRITEQELAEEIADVEIMCKQGRVIIGDGLVDLYRKCKERRLARRINGLDE